MVEVVVVWLWWTCSCSGDGVVHFNHTFITPTPPPHPCGWLLVEPAEFQAQVRLGFVLYGVKDDF